MDLTPVPSTDYGAQVIAMLAASTRESHAVDQEALRQCVRRASSHLVADTTTGKGGVKTWYAGFARLVDVMVALHARGDLELETVNAASKACSECWSVAGSWKEMEGARDGVRTIAGKIKGLLDANGRTYKGERVYAP